MESGNIRSYLLLCSNRTFQFQHDLDQLLNLVSGTNNISNNHTWNNMLDTLLKVGQKHFLTLPKEFGLLIDVDKWSNDDDITQAQSDALHQLKKDMARIRRKYDPYRDGDEEIDNGNGDCDNDEDEDEDLDNQESNLKLMNSELLERIQFTIDSIRRIYNDVKTNMGMQPPPCVNNNNETSPVGTAFGSAEHSWNIDHDINKHILIKPFHTETLQLKDKIIQLTSELIHVQSDLYRTEFKNRHLERKLNLLLDRTNHNHSVTGAGSGSGIGGYGYGGGGGGGPVSEGNREDGVMTLGNVLAANGNADAPHNKGMHDGANGITPRDREGQGQGGQIETHIGQMGVGLGGGSHGQGVGSNANRLASVSISTASNTTTAGAAGGNHGSASAGRATDAAYSTRGNTYSSTPIVRDNSFSNSNSSAPDISLVVQQLNEMKTLHVQAECKLTQIMSEISLLKNSIQVKGNRNVVFASSTSSSTSLVNTPTKGVPAANNPNIRNIPSRITDNTNRPSSANVISKSADKSTIKDFSIHLQDGSVYFNHHEFLEWKKHSTAYITVLQEEVSK